ncbi:MAG: serine/threonine-protein phosphatase [Myxococcales bacterium]|nr:serine/threonine-protein phosphatase [Myxococcales bacterium]MCB9752135.1 serine/threonine-protein phosphatase [Myxococcales bacterium]
MQIFASADIGQRDEQQDAYATSEQTIVVADGMGGHAGGAEASQAAVRAYLEELAPLVTRDAILDAIRWACQEVAAASVGGTTLVTASLVAEPRGWRALVAWVGDSRAYLVRDGEAELLTDDHAAPDGGLYRWLPDEATPDILELELVEGDLLVLCTDGVSNALDAVELAQCCDADRDPAEWIVEQALDAGASDNCTAVVCVL